MESMKTAGNTPSDLTDGERWWRDHHGVLMKNGYKLRARYQPGWKPSWSAYSKHPIGSEDSIANHYPNVMDAIRISDNARVAIKRLEKEVEELRTVEFLNEKNFPWEPDNNCVPLLHVFREDSVPFDFMVMPLLKRFDEPEFNSVDEVLDFMEQTLQGLFFTHGRGVAHRDCTYHNIMMDAEPLFPKGFHPLAGHLDASGVHPAKPLRRRDVPEVRYYFTSFGSSIWISRSESPLVEGNCSQDQELPELHQDAPYDVFRADVFLLGNVYRRRLVGRYKNLEFLSPLTDAMTQEDPAERPTIWEARERFDEIIDQQSPQSLRRLLVPRDTGKIDQLLCDLGSTKRKMRITLEAKFPRLSGLAKR